MDGGFVATPWGGDVADHRRLGGVRVPASGEARRDLPEGRFVRWRGRVIALEPVPGR